MDDRVHLTTIKHIMNKLYWIVCDDKETNVFEGRYQGRTRGEALKFLKQALGRKTLNGLVFTITEIPVPLIREIVAEILDGKLPEIPAPVDVTTEECGPETESEPPTAKPTPVASDGKPGNPGFGDDLWKQARTYWEECRCIRKTAEKFGLSPNSVKTRARREGWRK
jgi:hypothetical protein